MAIIATSPEAPVELRRQVLPFPHRVDNVLLAGVVKTVTVPAATGFALIKVITGVVWFNMNTTAATPAADTPGGANAGSGAWPVEPGDGPQLFHVIGVTSFSVFGTATATVSWYRDPSQI